MDGRDMTISRAVVETHTVGAASPIGDAAPTVS